MVQDLGLHKLVDKRCRRNYTLRSVCYIFLLRKLLNIKSKFILTFFYLQELWELDQCSCTDDLHSNPSNTFHRSYSSSRMYNIQLRDICKQDQFLDMVFPLIGPLICHLNPEKIALKQELRKNSVLTFPITRTKRANSENNPSFNIFQTKWLVIESANL